MSRARDQRWVSAVWLAAALLAACEKSSSSGGGDPGPGGDTEGPTVLVQFPTDGALTDEPSATLTMLAIDGGFLFGGVASVTVAGVAATSVGGDTWTATVPLEPGNNRLAIEAVDERGNRNASAGQLSIRREGSLWVDSARVAFDADRGQVLVLDPELASLFVVEPVSGTRTLRSGPGAGTGPDLVRPRDVEHVPGRDAAVVSDGALAALLLVDLGNGARTTLSSGTVGTGPTLLDPFGVAVEGTRNRVLVVDDVRSELLAVDLASGDRTTISSATVGTGPALVGPRSVAIDRARNRALVVLAPSRALVAVDLATGDRSVLSGGTTPPAFVTPADVVVDVFQDRALVADPGAAALVAVDLATGLREVLSASGATPVGFGPGWLQPAGVALHLGSVPLVADAALDALFEVGAVSGDRRILTRVAQGSGPSFARPVALGLFSFEAGPLLFRELLVADADERALFRFSIGGGTRTLLSGPGRGAGPPFVELTDVAVSGAPDLLVPCILALDAGLPGLVRVHVSLGDRTVVSGPGVGSGPELQRPLRFLLEGSTCATTALVLDRPLGGGGALVRVDLASGTRTILSDATHGSGVDFLDPVALERVGSPGTAFVLDAALPGILSVDLVTGNRTVAFVSPIAFADPRDMVFEHSALSFVIADAGLSALLVARLIPESLTVVSGAELGTGPSLPRPVALAFERSVTVVERTSLPLVHVVDEARGAVLTVNLDSGDRVLATK